MKNPLDIFVLFFVLLIMIVGIFVSINAQHTLQEMRYFDAPTSPVDTSKLA